jgi:hypothetical protein
VARVAAFVGNKTVKMTLAPATERVDGSFGHQLRPYQQELLNAAIEENVRPSCGYLAAYAVMIPPAACFGLSRTETPNYCDSETLSTEWIGLT